MSNRPQSHVSDAPPDCVGAACSVRPIWGGKTSAPSAGFTIAEMTPGISLVPEIYIASPSARTPTPNIDAHASISPVANGDRTVGTGHPGMARDGDGVAQLRQAVPRTADPGE